MGKLYRFCRRLFYIYFKIFYKFEIIGLENIADDENYVVCGNHIHIADPFVMCCVLPFQAHFMAKEESFKNPIVAWFLRTVGVFPVNRDANDLKAMKTALSILKQNKSLGLFPEGTRNKGYDPLPVKSGVSLFAIRTKTPILPITIDTTYKLFSPLRVVIHKPVAFTEYYGEKPSSDVLQELSTGVIKDIYASLQYYVPTNQIKGSKK